MAAIIEAASVVVDDTIAAMNAREIAIDEKNGRIATEAAALYGSVAGHQAKLNFGDCFSYAAAKAYRLPLIYRGNDFTETDLA